MSIRIIRQYWSWSPWATKPPAFLFSWLCALCFSVCVEVWWKKARRKKIANLSLANRNRTRSVETEQMLVCAILTIMSISFRYVFIAAHCFQLSWWCWPSSSSILGSSIMSLTRKKIQYILSGYHPSARLKRMYFFASEKTYSPFFYISVIRKKSNWSSGDECFFCIRLL